MSSTLEPMRAHARHPSPLVSVVLATQGSVVEGLEVLRAAVRASRLWLARAVPGGGAVLLEEACAAGSAPWWEPSAEVRLPSSLLWTDGAPQAVVVSEGASIAWLVNDGDMGLIALRGAGEPWQGGEQQLLGDAVCVLAGAVRRQAGQPLARLLETALLALPEAVVVSDPERVIRWLNPAAEALFGGPRGAWLGRAVRQLYADERDWATVQRQLLGGASAASPEVRLRRWSGAVFRGEVSGAVLRDEAGHAVGAVGMLRDVEGRRAAEGQRLRAERLSGLGAMAGGLAHDFNNLLTPVLANAAALLPELQVPEHREMATEIEQAARRAALLSRQLLTYLGQAPMQPAALDLAELVAGEQRALAESLPAAIRLEVRLSSAYTLGDTELLRQVLHNLVHNAAEAISPGQDGTVRVHVGTAAVTREQLQAGRQDLPPDTYTVLEVADNGEGMSERTLERLFDPFFTTRFTGRGLGLAVVQGVVRAHRGDVLVWSQRGAGSRVQVLLPRGEPLAAVPLPPLPAPARGRQVLLVEDEPAIQNVLLRLLRRSGLVVHLAPDGPTALEMARSLRASLDLILLDLSLPRLNGMVVLERLRQDMPQTPVIIMSGHRPGELSARFSELGATFLQKPFTIEDFTRALRQFLPRQDDGQGQVSR